METISWIFFIEFCVKVIAYGFIIEPNAYLRDAWNVLDFIVVVTGFTKFTSFGTNVGALRAIRLLRPLRSVNKIKSMKIIITSMI